MPISKDEAELFAARVLGWLSMDNARISAFLAWSGESPSDLGERLQDPDFLRATIEFLMGDEALLLSACDELGYEPTMPQLALSAMPGGETWNWT